jgi:membrane-bound lytic murein transglycosylase D
MPKPMAFHSLVLSLAASLLLAVAAPAAAVSEAGGITPQLKISHSLEAMAPAESEPSDLWPRLRKGMALPQTDNNLVQIHERWYAQRPDSLNRAVQRSRFYLFHIVEEVEKRGMPMEIALLPMIESGFDPRAESPRQASGLWQFIPSTGKVFGLKQNAWYDGRRDVLQATRAALDYLEKLEAMFGDWRLALAAYNCGEGCVARAVARNRAQGRAADYDHLDLPTETRHYVPKLLAVRNLILNPERYNIALDSIPNDPYFMQVKLAYPMEAKTAARLAEMNMDEFLALNPAYQRKVIYTDTPGILLLPADRIETFHFNLQRTGRDSTRLQTYQASRGELLDKIAQRFDVSLQWLKDHNPVKLYRGKLTAPEKLVLPVAAAGKAVPAEKVAAAEKTAMIDRPVARTAKPGKAAAKSRTHTVRKGDTLAAVARQYGVKLADLRQMNKGSARLVPGDTLLIPSANG